MQLKKKVRSGLTMFGRSPPSPNKTSRREKNLLQGREPSPTTTVTTTSTSGIFSLDGGGTTTQDSRNFSSKIFASASDPKRKPLVEPLTNSDYNQSPLPPPPPPPMPPPQRQSSRDAEKKNIQQYAYLQQEQRVGASSNSDPAYGVHRVPNDAYENAYTRVHNDKENAYPSTAGRVQIEESLSPLPEKTDKIISPLSTAEATAREWEVRNKSYFQPPNSSNTALTPPQSPNASTITTRDSSTVRQQPPQSPSFAPSIAGELTVDTNTTGGDTTLASWFQYWNRGKDTSHATQVLSEESHNDHAVRGVPGFQPTSSTVAMHMPGINPHANRYYKHYDPEVGDTPTAGGAFSGMGGGGNLRGDSQTNYVLNQRDNSSDRILGSHSCDLTMGMGPDEHSACADFREDEWTPQDSAYGAACPICGWIPKHIRRIIEVSLITLLVISIVYGVISLSVHISDLHKQEAASEGNHAASGNNANVNQLDDDYYVAEQP